MLEHLHQEEFLQGEGRQFLLEVWEVLVCGTYGPKGDRTRVYAYRSKCWLRIRYPTAGIFRGGKFSWMPRLSRFRGKNFMVETILDSV